MFPTETAPFKAPEQLQGRDEEGEPEAAQVSVQGSGKACAGLGAPAPSAALASLVLNGLKTVFPRLPFRQLMSS